MVGNSPKSYLLVAIQMLALALIILPGPWLARPPIWLLIELAGLGLGVWAVLAMRLSNFNIVPDVKPTGQLVRRGPYRWLRHPMYTALLLVTLALLLAEFSWPRLLLWLILLADLLIKLNYEEQLLAAHFAEYREYQQATKRLVPLLY